jgi:glycosyltransferase involved in cell wall biosynthesis
VSGVSLVFPAYNRLEFTKQAWAALIANTDWSLVEEFHVYDDGSTDGTRGWLEEVSELPAHVLLASNLIRHRTEFRSPMGVTLDWIRRSKAPLLAKLDNDTIYPPGWLNIALDVMARHPELDMLGLECMRKPATLQPKDDWYEYVEEIGDFGYLPAVFISGLGIYKRAAFAKSLPEDNGYFGLEEWQQAQAHLKYGWILPSLPVFLLDRMPIEPWKSLSEEYVRKGWQRKWSLDLRYKPEQSAMWEWWQPVK